MKRTLTLAVAFALVLAALLLCVGVLWPGRKIAALLIALAPGAGDLALATYWSTATAIGGRSSGAVSGLMNSSSTMGGFFSPILIGWVYDRWKNWNTVLMGGVISNVIAALLWLGVVRK